MAVRDFVTALRRHLMVTLTVAVLTVSVAALVKLAPPSYEARSVVTFLSPQAPFPRNSYASFTPALVTTAEVLTRGVNSAAGRSEILRAGGTTAFQVVLANRGNQELPIHDQPYLTVTVTGKDAARVRRTHLAVLEVLRDRLRREQVAQGARPGSFISWRVTAGSDRAVPVSGRPSRALLAILLLGGIGAVYAAVTADRRRAGASPRAAAAFLARALPRRGPGRSRAGAAGRA
ncbi:hypothetical protein [Spirillospora sp. NPDC047279]|uniref:hypothetical protein n=1 Tax=Spirillospora sp. NPDC047279 TaxID=3155478 RepID=UPI00340960FF